MACVLNPNMGSSCDPTNPLLVLCPPKTSITVLVAALFIIAKNWKQHRFPTTKNEYVNCNMVKQKKITHSSEKEQTAASYQSMSKISLKVRQKRSMT